MDLFLAKIKLLLVSAQCCLLQGEKYLMNGYVYKQMSPTAYFDVLRDYRNESMPLNNIGVRQDLSKILFHDVYPTKKKNS